MKGHCVKIAVLLFCFSATTWSGEGGQTGFAFLRIGSGARAAGMGEVGVASAHDPSAVVWNPALLTLIPRDAVTMNYNRWIEDVRHHLLAFKGGGERSAWAVHLIYTGVDGIQKREIPSESPTAVIGSHDLAIGVSYARQLNPAWTVGVTTRYLYERIESSVHGIGWDIGTTYDVLSGKDPGRIRAGLSMSNFGFSGKFVSEDVRLPSAARVGFLWRITPQDAFTEVRAAADAVHWFRQETFLHTGAELTYRQMMSLRAGYQFGYEAKSFSTGFGVRMRDRYSLDYAFAPLGQSLGSTHRITVGVEF